MPPRSLPHVYVAGPLRPSVALRATGSDHVNRLAVEVNVRAAAVWAARLVELGCVPVLPHAIGWLTDEAARTHGFVRGSDTDAASFWPTATRQMLTDCDAILMVPGWQDSVGSREELAHAGVLGLPCYIPDGNPAQDQGERLAAWVEALRRKPVPLPGLVESPWAVWSMPPVEPTDVIPDLLDATRTRIREGGFAPVEFRLRGSRWAQVDGKLGREEVILTRSNRFRAPPTWADAWEAFVALQHEWVLTYGGTDHVYLEGLDVQPRMSTPSLVYFVTGS